VLLLGKVVVGILNKNYVDVLPLCINSLLSQTYSDYVVLVIDGQSTDGSIEYLKDVSNKNSKIEYFIQENPGIGVARNEALEYINRNHSDATHVIWGDSENVYPSDYLENIMNCEGDIVGGRNIVISESVWGQSLWWYYNGLNGKGVLGNNEKIKYSILKELGWSNSPRLDDALFHQKAVNAGYTLSKCPGAEIYVNTANSIHEILNWQKVKAKGISLTGANENLSVGTFSGKHMSIYILIFLLLLSSLFTIITYFKDFLFVSVLLIYLVGSFFLFFSGLKYIKNVNYLTFFIIFPYFILHYPIIILFYIKYKFLMD